MLANRWIHLSRSPLLQEVRPLWLASYQWRCRPHRPTVSHCKTVGCSAAMCLWRQGNHWLKSLKQLWLAYSCYHRCWCMYWWIKKKEEKYNVRSVRCCSVNKICWSDSSDLRSGGQQLRLKMKGGILDISLLIDSCGNMSWFLSQEAVIVLVEKLVNSFLLIFEEIDGLTELWLSVSLLFLFLE